MKDTAYRGVRCGACEARRIDAEKARAELAEERAKPSRPVRRAAGACFAVGIVMVVGAILAWRWDYSPRFVIVGAIVLALAAWLSDVASDREKAERP